MRLLALCSITPPTFKLNISKQMVWDMLAVLQTRGLLLLAPKQDRTAVRQYQIDL